MRAILTTYSRFIKRIKNLFVVILLLVGFSGYAQNSEQITLEVKNASLERIFNQLERQSGYQFGYGDVVISDQRKFSLDYTDATLKDILDELSRQSGFEYRLSNRKVSVKFPEKRKVTGKVTEAETGEPLVGVTVLIKGSTQGTITDLDGNYNLMTFPKTTLQFSFVGFETEETEVGNRSAINVTLRSSSVNLEEIVVTAIGIERETRALGYSITKVDSDDVSRSGNPNLATALAGKVPGLQLTRSSGAMGSSRIVLRGESSLDLDNNRALIVIDGVPVTNDQNGDGEQSYLGAVVDYGDGLSALNPDDIENVTVLKGPTAAGLYGSQAANGVIMITTKSGQFDQKLRVTLRSTTSFQQVNRWLPRQKMFGSGNRSERDYYSFRDSPDGGNTKNSHSWGPKYMGQNFYQYNSPHTAVYDPDRRNEIWEYEVGGQTPWQPYDIERDFYETGFTQVTGVSVDAGNSSAYFRGSLDYLTNEYIMANTGYERLNLSISSGVKVGKSQFSTKINYVNQTSDNLPAEGYDRQNAHYQVFWLNSNDNLAWFRDNLWFDGQENIQQDRVTGLSANPYWILQNSINTLDKDRVFGKLQFDHEIAEDFKITARSGIDFYTELRTRERAWSEPRNRFGKYNEQSLKTLLLNTDIFLSKKWKLNTLELTGTAGFNHFYKDGNDMFADTGGSNNGDRGLRIPGVFNIANSIDDPIVRPGRNQEENYATYGVVSANYRDMIYLDITGRNEWTSTLPKGNNSYFYPSAALAVDVTEALKLDFRPLSYLKLRASAAQVGSDTRPYRLDRYYAVSNSVTGGYSNPSTLPNPALKPETTNSVELGLDLHLFDHRLNFDATFYRSVTKDQILTLPVDSGSGYLNALMNAGSVSNRGIELQLGAKPFNSSSFGWDITANWSANRGKVEELVPGVIDTYIIGRYVGSRVLIKAEPGEQLGRIYGKGYDKHEGQIIFKDGLAQRDNDEDYLGNVFPDWRAGIINSIRYKNFRLSFQFDYQHGGNAYSITHFLMNYTGKSDKTVLGRESGAPFESGAEYDMAAQQWIQNADGRFGVIGDGLMWDEDAGGYVKNTVSAGAPYYYNSMYERDQIEGNVHETTFLKLRDLRLEYQIPALWMFKGGTFAVFGNELFIWTDFPSYDPELAVANNGSLTPGLEAVGSPSTRTFGVDIKLTF
ncbi:SusC/RagA family TonB-linked outer membrane protein [Fulvivirga sp. M361]|uniref:SusC/RagA family TonB-linked outer membrane protein n=1 Tax=Fulvivirga sp. M361 TaxID=2594266 RepID=UPI00117B54FB|nr:SusC/RagA family TonB-linked outer membrane protein [Fulvivirga sp. M361]TRX59140.1 SusC/RagA family TonB-linked outer membrane protein [Fulvivirga sp. M361]